MRPRREVWHLICFKTAYSYRTDEATTKSVGAADEATRKSVAQQKNISEANETTTRNVDAADEATTRSVALKNKTAEKENAHSKTLA